MVKTKVVTQQLVLVELVEAEAEASMVVLEVTAQQIMEAELVEQVNIIFQVQVVQVL